jgi:putative membrane-bound dehydrogenase-like protein
MSRLTFAALILLPLAADAADIYQVGLAQVDITPSYSIRLNGFGFRRTESEGVYQRIWARAMAIEDESKEPALLITVDVLGIPDDIRLEIAKRLEMKAKLKPERLAITATHTHTAPMLKGANVTIFGTPIPKEHLDNIDKYTIEFIDKLEKVGLDALAKREPAKLSYAIGTAKFAKNRRTAGGPVDHDLPVLFVHSADGKKLRAIYTSYACHCVTLSFNKIDGDWAGFAAEAIEREFPGAMPLVSVGCGADQNPTSNVTGDKIDVAQLQGREVATEVKRLAGNFRTSVTGKLVTQWKQIELPLADHPTRAQWEEKAKRNDAIGHHARVTLEKLDRKEALPTRVDYPIQTWSFGEPGASAIKGEPGASATGAPASATGAPASALAIVFLPGEVVVDYSLRLKKELDGQRLWMNAYANGAPCYIPSERILKEGGYEGGGAMIYYDLPGPFKPGLEEPIVAVVKEQLRKSFPPKFDAKKVNSLPLSPQQSLAAIQTKPNLVVELVAAEPLVDSPVFIDFGPDGKLWVCEMIDYPEGKTGKYEPGGRIRFLEDTDGDGRMDKATTFLDGIPFPTGVKVWRKGVLVCAAPDILFAEDTNGDGKADVVKKLFSGFGTGNYQARVNALEYGLDGWVYGSCGFYGGKIKSFNGKTYDLGNRDFRIKPDTGELEPVSGASQQGRVRDDWGNWFGCDNSTLIRHYPLDDHYLKRNPHVTPPPASVFVPADPNPNRLFPINQNAQRFALSGPPGNVTAACGLCIYRDNLLGDDFKGNAFVCEPVNLVVHRLKLTPKGSTFEGHRPSDEKDREFLASTDNWFRPVQATTGPDGCLWIVDMYRHVIEHPRWIPPQELEKLDLRAGAGMGRIYRVRPKTAVPRKWQAFDLADERLTIEAVASPNGWTRDMVYQMGAWRYAATLETRKLEAAIASRLIEADKKRISDPDPHKRRYTIKVAEKHYMGDISIGLEIAKRFDDPDGQVRLQVAYTLGNWAHPKAAEALGRMAVKYADDPYLVAAVLSSVNEKNLAGVLASVLKESRDKGPPSVVVAQLMRMAATKNREAQVELLTAASTPKDGKYARWQYEALAGYFDRPIPVSPILQKQISDAQTAAFKVVSDPKASEADRLVALRLVGRGDKTSPEHVDALRALLAPSTSPALRSAAIAQIGRLAGDRTDLLIEGWKSHPPETRAQILDVLLGRRTGPYRLLTAIEAKTIAPSEVDASRRQRLLMHADAEVRDRAAKLFEGANADRAKVLQDYADTPAIGDPVKGKAVFTKVCAACHKLGDVGVQVGPDLAMIANRSPAFLLQEILDPNRNLDSRYIEYQAVTKGMRTVTGLLAGETSTSLTLRGQQAKDETLLRSDIEELRGSGKSLMPEGLEKDISKKDMADLIAFITHIRPAPKVIAGNTPTLVKPANGRLRLSAPHAEIYGNDITLEPDFWNIGMWHGVNDRVEWRIELPARTTYDIFFDYACDPNSAGNELIIEGIDPPGRWKVPSTGAWSKYQTVRVAIGHVAQGESRIVIRPAGALKGALLDLRTVFLVPPGQTPDDGKEPKKKPKEEKDPTDPAEIAKLILDDKQSAERRNRLIANNPLQAAKIVEAMAKDIPDEKEEYRRIPWIWRVAVASGKRNKSEETRAMLDVALPGEKEKLRDWQAVVIGGGIINGISLVGDWPGPQIGYAIGDDRTRLARWQSAIEQSFQMADNPKVKDGTRYDALRMIALAEPDKAIPALSKYLVKDTNAELQMGAVSGLGDIRSEKATELLVKGLPDFAKGNRDLAIAALLRTADRARALLDALAAGNAKKEWLNESHRKGLLNHGDGGVRDRAAEVLGK